MLGFGLMAVDLCPQMCPHIAPATPAAHQVEGHRVCRLSVALPVLVVRHGLQASPPPPCRFRGAAHEGNRPVLGLKGPDFCRPPPSFVGGDSHRWLYAGASSLVAHASKFSPARPGFFLKGGAFT